MQIFFSFSFAFIRKVVSLHRPKFTSGTIPQAQKVCRFCIYTYELRYKTIYRVTWRDEW